jgi:penicillin amidase
MQTETISVEGLSQPARITIDRWGIPHIRANTFRDIFFVQGFNAARDRLWQMDLWRKRGLGLLAADFGPGYLAQDRASRLFLYRGGMDREWPCYSDDAEMICAAFVAGVNAYIRLVEREPGRLPPEFAMLGTRPACWAPEDVLRIRSHSLMRNALSEVLRANVTAKAGAEADRFRQRLDPERTPKVPEGVDLGSIPLQCLDVFKLARANVTFEEDRLAAPLEEASNWSRVTPYGEVLRQAMAEGSNNWVIHGSRTASGRPILANDPHRAHGAPALRYLVHLCGPGFDGIGAGEPVLPGISIGHNGTSAFGLTLFFGPDQEDVYVYETHPEDPNRYRYGEGWETMRVVNETTAVRGAADQIVALKFTRHGPVVHEEPEKRRAFAIRSVWLEPGSAPYAVSLASMRSRDLDAFRAAMRRWSVPAVNQVYADTSGAIAWIPTGFSPVRRNWDGLLPVPGDGRYEWDGFLDPEELPRLVDPESGYFATANEMNLPPDWPHGEKQVGFEWLEGSRAARINEVIASAETCTVEGSCALQTDALSIPARRLSRLWSRLEPSDSMSRQALAILAEWDFRLLPDSGAAALFEVWWSKHLRPGLHARVSENPDVRALLAPGDVETALRALEEPARCFGPDGSAERDRLLLATLARAFAECASRMGEDPAAWKWGRIHHGYFPHAAGALAKSRNAPALDVGPVPKGGSDSTPMNAAYRLDDFRVMLGASFRMVLDVGDWDNSRCVNAPGQSGDPASPHYADLVTSWATGGYVPLLYSAAAIESAAELHIDLTPADASRRPE